MYPWSSRQVLSRSEAWVSFLCNFPTEKEFRHLPFKRKQERLLDAGLCLQGSRRSTSTLQRPFKATLSAPCPRRECWGQAGLLGPGWCWLPRGPKTPVGGATQNPSGWGWALPFPGRDQPVLGAHSLSGPLAAGPLGPRCRCLGAPQSLGSRAVSPASHARRPSLLHMAKQRRTHCWPPWGFGEPACLCCRLNGHNSLANPGGWLYQGYSAGINTRRTGQLYTTSEFLIFSKCFTLIS